MKRIAILGGGMSSLVTALQLTERDPDRTRYEITIYQQGFRLGGKGASGRNADHHDRIEEHGLHLLFGFYENTFEILRRCHTLAPGGSPTRWREVFKPLDGDVVMIEQAGGSGEPKSWPVGYPTAGGGEPGDGVDPDTAPWIYVRNVLAWIARQVPLGTAIANLFAPPPPGMPHGFNAEPVDVNDPDELRAYIDALRIADRAHALGLDAGNPVDPIVEAHRAQREMTYPDLASHLSNFMPEQPAAQDETDRSAIGFLLDKFRKRVWASPLMPDGVRRLRTFIDFFTAAAIGITVDLIRKGDGKNWFALDHMDLREWLRFHGASEETVRSPPVEGLYDAVFASYTNQLGAGTILQAALRAAFGFKGSVVYKMHLGMGDAVFAPLYEVLHARGVRFRFFHKVKQLELSPDRSRIERVIIERQVDLAAPRRPDGSEAEYDPLIGASGGPRSWPDRPRFEQIDQQQARAIQDGEVDLENAWSPWTGTETSIAADRDFDDVVLGISIGALPFLCEALIEDRDNPAFGQMVRGILTTQTQALQLWLKPKDLGWPGRIVVPYADPYDTVADMSHLIAHEGAPAGSVGTIAYLCSALDESEPIAAPGTDPDYPARQLAIAGKNAADWIRDRAKPLWTNAPKDTDGHLDPAAIEGRYVNVPVNPSDRYVLSATGSHRFRLGANQSGYANLYMTGDWLRTALSTGCLEAATMAGIQTARAIDPTVPKAKGDWLDDPEPRPAVPRRLAARRGDYIFRDGELLAKPPIGLDLTVSMFLLGADQRQLARVCDRYLNIGGDVVYRPAGPYVILYCAEMDNVTQPWGRCPERDFGVWLPVVGSRREGGTLIDDRLATFTPYIWVNSGLAVVGGRSLFGFPKQLGVLGTPGDATAERAFTIDAEVMHRIPDTARTARVLTVSSPTGFTRRTSFSSWLHLLAAMADKAGTLFGGVPFPLSLLSSLDGGMRAVFLKQFPDETDGNAACYQAIIEGRIDITPGSLSGGPLDGAATVTIARNASHPIVESLGLATTATGAKECTLRPIAQGWMGFKATVQAGRTIFRSV